MIVHCNETNCPRNHSLRSWFGVGEDFPIVAVPMRIDSVYAAENIPVIEYRIKEMAEDIVSRLIGGQCIPGAISYAPRLMLKGTEIIV